MNTFVPTKVCPICGRPDCPGAYYIGPFARKWVNGMVVPALRWLG